MRTEIGGLKSCSKTDKAFPVKNAWVDLVLIISYFDKRDVWIVIHSACVHITVHYKDQFHTNDHKRPVARLLPTPKHWHALVDEII
jgi:hypothetical protein